MRLLALAGGPLDDGNAIAVVDLCLLARLVLEPHGGHDRPGLTRQEPTPKARVRDLGSELLVELLDGGPFGHLAAGSGPIDRRMPLRRLCWALHGARPRLWLTTELAHRLTRYPQRQRHLSD